MAFFGRFDHALDERGRVAIPARFREELRGGWVTAHPAGYLLMYPALEWAAIGAGLRHDPLADPLYSGYVRRFYADSQEITWDNQGRILLLPQLRQHAGLNSTVVFVGVNNAVEVHSEHGFEAATASLAPEEWEAMRRAVLAEQRQEPAGAPPP